MYQHILLPTDGSELSGRAIKAGIEFAKALKAGVTGLYAAPHFLPLLYKEIALDQATQSKYEELAQAKGRQFLQVIESMAKALDIRYEGVVVVSDTPFDAIIQTALNKGCDLIFMAPHGNQSALGLPLGSNTNKVLTYSKIPVLVHR
jgi:nucleotide-binding universal stress UspA family protein